MAESKKTITTTLQVKDLIHDIQNKAFLTGRSREAEGKKGYEASSNMQASDDSEDSYQIARSLANAFSVLKAHLSEFLNESTTTVDNLIQSAIDSGGTLSLSLKMPSNYNTSSAQALGNSIHAYLVEMALAEWFTITNKEDADTYIAKSGVSLENIKLALYKRSRPTRPTYSQE